MLKCGIIGLPLSGKSTVFNVVTRAGAEVKPYASGKTDPNRAMVNVPDERFDNLVRIFEPRKETPATVEFVDLAGLSRNASKGEGLGNSFLSFVSESDALVHVIRLFENPDVPHPENIITVSGEKQKSKNRRTDPVLQELFLISFSEVHLPRRGRKEEVN